MTFRGCVFFLCVMAQLACWCQPVHLYDTSRIDVLGRHLQLLEDPTGTRALADVMSDSNSFRPSHDDIPNFKVTRSRVWARLQLVNHTRFRRWYVESSNPNINSVSLYVVGSAGISSQHSGFTVLPERRKIDVHHVLFPLDLPKDSTVTVYMSFWDVLPLQVNLAAGPPDRFLERYEALDFMHGIFFGLMFMLVIYNAFIYVSIRDRVYLFYVLYVLANAWFISFLTGYGIRVPLLAHVLNAHPSFVPFFLGVASCAFSIVFLDMRRTFRTGYRVTLFMLALLFSVPALDLAGFRLESILLVQLFGLLFSVVSFIFGMVVYRRGHRAAKFYLVGWTAYLVGLILHITTDLRLIPFNVITHNSLEIFTAVEAVLLSMAVGDKISLFKEEKEAAQEESLAAAMKNEQLVREQNVVLAERVRERTSELEEQKKLVEEKNKEIVDSINYARRIQYALLAHGDVLQRNIRDHFILFMPKDIVSGDFYWAAEVQGRFYLAVCDSTGHGVPGAFMSLLNMSYLNEAVIEKGISSPSSVFDHVRMRLTENIGQGGQDGMDGVLLCIDGDKLSYAAAHNGIIEVFNGESIVHHADKMPVGRSDHQEPFTACTLPGRDGAMLYLFTDGYADQFGGPREKKFLYRRFRELLVEVSSMPLEAQRERLAAEFANWKGKLEQVDDVLVIGIRLPASRGLAS